MSSEARRAGKRVLIGHENNREDSSLGWAVVTLVTVIAMKAEVQWVPELNSSTKKLCIVYSCISRLCIRVCIFVYLLKILFFVYASCILLIVYSCILVYLIFNILKIEYSIFKLIHN